MEDYDKIEQKCLETKRYAKRVIDLYCDAKKWKWLAQESDNEEEQNKFMNISNILIEMFNSEIQNMKL